MRSVVENRFDIPILTYETKTQGQFSGFRFGLPERASAKPQGNHFILVTSFRAYDAGKFYWSVVGYYTTRTP